MRENKEVESDVITPLGLLSWLLMGLMAGLLASRLLPGTPPLGGFLASAIGIVGAVLGGLLATALDFGGVVSFDPRSLAIAAFGAVLSLLVLRFLRLAT